jgi:hypothetical protein
MDLNMKIFTILITENLKLCNQHPWTGPGNSHIEISCHWNKTW